MAKKLGMQVEHYVISSGMKEIIEGTEISKNFKKHFLRVNFFTMKTAMPYGLKPM